MSIPARISIVTLGARDLRRSVAFHAAIGPWEVCCSTGFPIGPDGRIEIA